FNETWIKKCLIAKEKAINNQTGENDLESLMIEIAKNESVLFAVNQTAGFTKMLTIGAILCEINNNICDESYFCMSTEKNNLSILNIQKFQQLINKICKNNQYFSCKLSKSYLQNINI